jgi:hypothetical protein
MLRIGLTERPAEDSWVLRGGFVDPCAKELRPGPQKTVDWTQNVSIRRESDELPARENEGHWK